MNGLLVSNRIAGKWQVATESVFVVICLVGLLVNSHEKALRGPELDRCWVREIFSSSWLEILCVITTPTGELPKS